MPDSTFKEAHLMQVAVHNSHNLHSIITENLQTYKDLEEDLVRIRQMKSSHIVHQYRVRQKYLTIFQHSCEWNCWRGKFVFERPSSETQSSSVAVERWSVEHGAFTVETYLKKQRFCRSDSADISSALQYFWERQCPQLQYSTVVGEKLQRNSVCHKK